MHNRLSYVKFMSKIKHNRNEREFWQPYVKINNCLNCLTFLKNNSKIKIVSETKLIEKRKYADKADIFREQQNRPTVIKNVGSINKRKLSTDLAENDPDNNFVDVVNGISTRTKIPTSPVTCYCRIPLLPNMINDDPLIHSQRYQGHYITVYTKSDFTPIDDMEILNNIPIEDLFNPGEDINIEDYL